MTFASEQEHPGQHGPRDERFEALSRAAARRAAETRLLAGIASVAAAEDDVQRILAATLDRIGTLVRFSDAAIALVDGDRLVVHAAVGPFANNAIGRPRPRGSGRGWQVIETGRAFSSRDPAADGVSSGGSDPVRSYLAVPLSWRGRCFGLLEVDSTEPNAFGDGDAALLEGVAAVLSGSIELVGRFAAEVQLRERLAEAVESERRARAEAEEAVRTRDQFLSIASHELKTPLTPIKAGAQLLMRAVQQPEIDRERITRQLRTIDGQVDRLRMLVDDLLDTARIQGGRLELRPEDVDLTDVVARIVAAWDEKNRPRIVFESTGSIVGRWDPYRLEQVVTNLVDNALKYSPPTEQVDVVATRDADEALLIVTDRGIGIPPQAQERIFEPFARGSNASARNYGGLGLGLFITRQLIERHGGRIELESKEGQGTRFRVRLPLGQAG